MRDKKRIPRILNKIKRLWLRSPDQRFYQMLINKGIIPDSQLWNIEDDIVEKEIDRLLKEKEKMEENQE